MQNEVGSVALGCGWTRLAWGLWTPRHTFTPRRCAAMTVSMKAIHAGRGYDYLLKFVTR